VVFKVWFVWRSCCVDGIADDNVIADKFAQHFAKVCTNNSASGADRLAHDYSIMKSGNVRTCLMIAVGLSLMLN